MEKKFGLNANTIKLLAILAMTVDHIAWVFLPQKQELLPVIMHSFGRITAPVMCFFIAEGLHYTKNLKKYILRLFAFAVPAHFAYGFAFGHPLLPTKLGDIYGSMLWTLAWGLIALAALKSDLSPVWKGLITAAAYLLTLQSDWYYEGITMILIFGLNRGSFKRQAIGITIATVCFSAVNVLSTGDALYAAVNLGILLSLPILSLYNGERGKLRLKWLFYGYYPAHLAVLGALKLLMG